MTRDHEKYAPLLDAFIDAELSEEKMAEVGFHVAECPDCQRYTRDAARIREAFPGLDAVTVPDGFAESVMAALPTRKGAYNMENNNNLEPWNEAVPENTDINANPGVNNNNNNNNAGNGGAVDFQNANNNAGNNGDKNARNWRNIAVGLAACLAVLAAVQISGAFSPNRGATEKVGAAVAGGGAAADQSVEETAEPADAGEMNSAENAPEASENEAESAETDITTTAEESAADNADVSDLNSLDNAEVTQEIEEVQPEAAEQKQDTSADNNSESSNNETARSAESVQNTEIPEEDDLAPDPDEGEPDSILNGASLAEAEENDGGGENKAAENPVAESPAYEAALTLPADAAPIFSAFEPLETASDGVWYAFSHDDYAAILEQLDGAGFVGNDIRIPRTDVIYVFVES